MDHQDWQPVVLYKSTGKNVNNANIQKKPTKFQTLDGDDPPIPQKIERKVSSEISKKRNAKGLTQKKLASQLNLQPSVINDYESGKVIPDKTILRKIMNVLR